jgi:hypothetical protein
MSDETEALKAEIIDLKEQMEAMKRLMGETGTSFSRLKINTEGLLGPFGSLVDATRTGATGLSVYNTSLDKGGKVVEMFTGLMGEMGKGLNLSSEALVKYVQMVNLQSDELYKSYQGLSSVGAAGKADLQSIMDTAKQFGAVSEKDLPKFTQMVAQNSETLAKFGGTVSEGLKLFGNVSAEIQQSGLQTQFMNMGMTVDSINKGMAGYLKIQTQTGAAQKMSTDELAAGAAEYLKNLDTLSKLTGKSGEAIQKEREERMMNEAYALHTRQLEAKIAAGGEEGLKAQKQKQEEDKVLTQTQGDVNKGFRAMFAGVGAQTEEGRRLMMSAPEASKKAAEGFIDAADVLDTAAGEATKNINDFSTTMALGNKTFSNAIDLMALENKRKAGSFVDQEAKAKSQQKGQIEAPGETVAAQTALTQEQRKATEDLTNFVSKGIEPTQLAMLKLAEATRGVADLLPGAKSAAPVGSTAAEKKRFEELQQKQKTEQGLGPLPRRDEKDRGAEVGAKPTAERPTLPGGRTQQQILDSAKKKSNELADAIDAAKVALDEKVTELTGDAKTSVEKLIKWLGDSKVPTSQDQADNQRNHRAAPADGGTPPSGAGGGPLPPRNRSFVEPLPPRNRSFVEPKAAAPAGPAANARPQLETLTANISQGYINVNSATNIKFPEMNTRYSPTVKNDAATELKNSDDVETTLTDIRAKFAGTGPEKNSNEDLVASNALVAAKMDELISLMRTSNGYQYKISQQTYA